MTRVHDDFFRKPALELAEALLGRIFVHDTSAGKRYRARIVETEAYLAAGDAACHAHKGMTERNRVMYAPPGTLYVYFSYGCHHLMNIVTEPEGVAGAVLLRAMEPLEGVEHMERNRKTASRVNLMNGPGKLTSAMEITLEHNGLRLSGDAVYIEEGDPVDPALVRSSPRIGISKATKLSWRRYVANCPYVSKPRPGPPREKKGGRLET
ncbi:3-methyladenine DNA glycosylase [Prosthecochloris sp. GSB1]|uniref:DNA-3-methyladenine glycosylase n=1 Tax=Prosthecochloris sp. GSB1 TaxID=281093 RepID=UPI000B8CCD02|nr:DNA-3-methyladenine glycosylase [Prosthecochloris sp. GSB1]ASQ91209.1 3-methyladenine DNA glycosylase [Prosthecochloris sp. GSB1]